MKHAAPPTVVFLFVLSCFFAFAQEEKVLTEAEQKEQKVVDRYWTLLEKTPRRGTSLDRVYGYYVDTGRMDELVARCRESTEKNPENAEAWLLLGLVLSRRTDDAATTEALEKARSLDTTRPLASFYLGEVYIAQGRLQDAADALEEALERSLNVSKTANGEPNDRKTSARDVLAVLQTLGRVYERFGDRENSAKVWNKLEELFPGDVDILVRIAETLEEEGKFEEAFDRYRRLAEMSKDDRFAKVQYTLAAADIKIRLGDKQGAIDDFEKLLEELSGESWLAQSIRDRVERIFVRQADYAGLAGYYQKRLEKHPDELETIRRLAIALVRLSRTGEAKDLLTGTLEKAPSNIPLRLALIDLLVADKQFGDVGKHYAKIDEIEPNNPDHVSQWGLAVLENKELSEEQRKAATVKIWSRLIAAKPKDAATVVMVADLMSTAKISEEAEKLYKTAVELRPGDPGYLEYLAYFYHHQERKDEAVATLRKIAEDGCRTSAHLAQLGGIFKSLGYTEESVVAFREAVQLDPKDFELRMQLASILFGNEDFGQAEMELHEAEKLIEPVGEDFARFLQASVKLLQATGRLDETAQKLAEALEKSKPEETLRAASDYWRLAVYRAAQNRDIHAVEAVKKALELQPNANALLEAAAKIFEQSNDPERAATIYRRLADADPQRRIDHLKRLANLQRDLGQIDKALETARLVMATGAGNAANSRFYADMLLNVGRSADGIEALRRAVRLDPTDTTTLSYLAEALFGAEQIDEALEILWRIFERTEDLQSKIGAVTRMSNYYQQSQRFDQLVQRLRQISKDAASRRESAYCLAQAYVTVSDFDAARHTLETLLLGAEAASEGVSDKVETDDTLLLSQLSSIAELQGDLATAIRYQEMLCDRVRSGRSAGPENERLLGLYQLSGEKNKAVDHLLRTLIEEGELHDKLHALDGLLAREDYESAQKVLERIEAKHRNSWEVLYRRLMLRFWMGNLNSAEMAAKDLLSLNLPREEMSAKKKHEEEKRKTAQPGAGGTPQPRARNMPHQGYNAWVFGNDHGYYASSGGTVQQKWNQAANELLRTIFRDRLQLERYFYNRGFSNTVEPAKPQFTPETFEEARFAASLWMLRIAMQRDLDRFRTEHPVEEGKLVMEAKEENGLKLERLAEAVSRQRTQLPADTRDTDELSDRLRFELFLVRWQQTAKQQAATFGETNYDLFLFGDLLENDRETDKSKIAGEAVESGRMLRNDIEFELSLRGGKDWFQSSYNSILTDLVRDHSLDAVKEINVEQEFLKTVKEADAAEKFTPEEIETVKGYVIREFEKAKESAEKRADRDKRSKSEKIDWLLKCWDGVEKDSLVVNVVGGSSSNLFTLVQSYSRFIKILRREGRSDDADRLTASLETVAGKQPWAYSVIVGSVVNDLFDTTAQKPFSITMLLLPRTPQGRNQPFMIGIPIGNETQESDLATRFLQFVRQRENRIDPALDDDRFETLTFWLMRTKDAALKNRNQAAAPSQARNFRLPPQTQIDQILSQYLTARSAAIRSLFQRFAPEPGSGGVVAVVPGMAVTADAAAPDKPLTREQVDQILATEKEFYRVLDRYFELVNEIEAKTKDVVAVQRPPGRHKLPTIGNYRHYFENNQTLQGYEIQSILQGQSSPNVVMASQELTLSALNGLLSMLDEGLKKAKFGDDVEPVKPEFVQKFQKYLDEKNKTGTDVDRKLIANIPKQPGTAGMGNVVVNPNDFDVEKTLKQLEDKRKESEEKGEAVDPKELFALALLYKTQNKVLEAIRCLDAMTFTGSGDIRMREQLALKWFAGEPDSEELKKRAERAVDRLRGFQLKGDELKALRQALDALGRKDEAGKIFDRLLVAATDLQTQYELLEELRVSGDASKPQAIAFALKVFRSPAIRNAANAPEHDYSWHVRNRCLEVLKKHGKLGEIVEQIEAQWKSSPGSLDMMTALADIYNRAGRKEDAKRIVKQMAEKIPDDAQKMQKYANLLRNLGMNDESAEWMQKALAKNPEIILQNFWQYDNTFQSTKQIKKLIEILKTIKPQRLAAEFGQFGYRVMDWLNNKEYADSARDLLQYVWEMEGVPENERKNYRFEFVQSLCSNGNHKELYPMFRTVVFDFISPEEETPGVQTSHHNPFSIRSWSSDKGYCIISTFLDLADKSGTFKDLDREIQSVLDALAKLEPGKRNKNRENAARLLSAFVEARKKNVDKTVEIIEELKKDDSFNKQFAQNGFVIAQELTSFDHPKTVRWAIEYFEAELKKNQGSYVQRVVINPLYRLYLKTDDREKGRKLALEKLRESFRYLKLSGNNYNYQVGNTHYSVYDLQETALSMSKALIENGCSFDVMLVYREMYDGQSWVSISKERHDYRYREIDQISKGLGEKSTAKDFVDNIDLLIPDPSAEGFDAEKRMPLMLGHYYEKLKVSSGIPFAATDLLEIISGTSKAEFEKTVAEHESKGPLIGLRLTDALKAISTSDPDRYETLRKRLEILADKTPGDSDVLIALASVRQIDGDREAVRKSVRQLARWIREIDEGDEKTEISDAVYFGCWCVARGCFEDETFMRSNEPEIRRDLETLFLFTGRLIGRRLSKDSDDAGRLGLLRTLVFDMKRCVPAELMDAFRPVFNTEMLGADLFGKSGAVISHISQHYEAIGNRLADAVKLQATVPAVELMEKVFQNGWPRIEENSSTTISREHALQILTVYEKVMRAVRKNGSAPTAVYGSLEKIVLPKARRKAPFVADYADLGGLNGYYRSPMIDLVDWAVDAGQVDELKKRIDEKRKGNFSAPPTAEEVARRLDALEFALALKQNDTAGIEQWKKSFCDGIGHNEHLAAKYALIVAVPTVKTYEDAEIDDAKFSQLADLIDAAVRLDEDGEPCRRYTYYAIRSFYERFARNADLPAKIRWLERYRKIDDPAKMNGFRFTIEDRLYREGLEAIAGGNLTGALAVLEYFAACPPESFRYRDLTGYLDALGARLEALSDSERTTTLAGFDLAKTVRKGTAKRTAGHKEAMPAPEFDLPKLPEGTVVYRNDFETETGPAWSIDRRDVIPNIEQTFLGDFYEDRLRFHLEDLPEHRLLRIRFDLLVLGGIDGLVGQPRNFGVDVWGMTVDDKPGDGAKKPIVTTFSNFHKDPNNQKQSFPDDYPPEFDFEPGWYDKVLSDSLWGDELEKGYYFGGHGARLENKFGYEKDSLYAVDIVVPHDSPELSIGFFSRFQDGPFNMNSLNKTEGEAWGLDHFQVEVIDKPLELDEDSMKKCFDALIGSNALKAHAARWRLVAAGNASADFIKRWFEAPENEAKRKEIQRPGNFDLFRILRVLDLIATPESETLRRKIEAAVQPAAPVG